MLCLSALTLGAPARAGSYSGAHYTGGTYYGQPPGAPPGGPYDPSLWGVYPVTPPTSPGGSFDIGSGSPSQAACSGPITAKFTYTPAPGQTAQSDPPPQKVVVVETCTASAYGYDFPPAAVGGACDDGMGQSLDKLPQIPVAYGDQPPVGTVGSGSVSGTRYTVLSPAADGSVTVTCAPSASATPTPGDSGGNPGNVGAGASVDYTANVYPLALASVVGNNDNLIFNPLGRPDLGDGSNQYVYTADRPDGYLYVPGAYQAVGGDSSVQQWLLDNNIGDLKIENSIIPNNFAHLWSNTGSSVAVNTPQNVDNPYPSYQFNRWIFKGLPAQNNQFGTHDVNLYVQGSKVQTAKIQTFYNGSASNYPGATTESAPNGYDTANWYHFYSQVYPTTTTYDPQMLDPSTGQPVSDVAGLASYRSMQTAGGVITQYATKMGPLTMNYATLPVFGISPRDNFLYEIGVLRIKGIYSYLAVTAHELEHIALWNSGDAYPAAYPPPGVVDADGDSLPDSVEGKYHLDPESNDTTGCYENPFASPDETTNTGRGDVEAICDIAALERILKYQNAWQNDWSDIGVEFGQQPAYFPWEFDEFNDAGDIVSRDTTLPSNAITSLPE